MQTSAPLSFLPDGYLETKARRRANMFSGALFAVTLAVVAATFMYTERQARDASRLHDAKLRQYTDEARRIAQADELRNKEQRLSHKAELAASLLEKVPRSFILADVTNALPRGVSLLQFSLESKLHVEPAAATPLTAYGQRKATLDAARAQSAATTGLLVEPVVNAKVYDVTLKMTGIAGTDEQVAQFISHLNACKRMKDVNLVVSEEFKEGDASVRKFQIEATLNPNADVRGQATAPATGILFDLPANDGGATAPSTRPAANRKTEAP
jgi:hypothetical protein